MKHILIKSVLENIKTESGIVDIENAVLNITRTMQDTQKVRVHTELFLSEEAIDDRALSLQYKGLDNLSIDKQLFIEQMVILVCDKLTAMGYDVENLITRQADWVHDDQSIRIFLSDAQVRNIAFGEGLYSLISYVHNNDIVRENTDTGSWLYLINLLDSHRTVLDGIGAFIQTKDEYEAI